MNLHEYQAKQLFASYGLPVPKSVIAHSVEESSVVVNNLNAFPWIVKAQVHAGGRGKAGGVKMVHSMDELKKAARSLLHTQLVTYQTDSKGQPVNQILIEEASKIEKEFYLGAVIDSSTKLVTVIASSEGGVEIEKVAEKDPTKILKTVIDPLIGVMSYQGRDLAEKLNLNEPQTKQFIKILQNLYKLFVACDLSLVEINPLVITKEGHLLCLDAKLNVDDNALYRQPKLSELRDTSQENEKELLAREWELNYVALDGDIGCMVNGAGLAMATMDLIKLHGGDPANFLDVGGGATKERVQEAFKIILSDKKVKTILVNIFGGIVRCDLIAEGIISAVSDVRIPVPVVVRLEGNRAKEARVLLEKSGLNIIPAASFTEAAILAVKHAKENK